MGGSRDAGGVVGGDATGAGVYPGDPPPPNLFDIEFSQEFRLPSEGETDFGTLPFDAAAFSIDVFKLDLEKLDLCGGIGLGGVDGSEGGPLPF